MKHIELPKHNCSACVQNAGEACIRLHEVEGMTNGAASMFISSTNNEGRILREGEILSADLQGNAAHGAHGLPRLSLIDVCDVLCQLCHYFVCIAVISHLQGTAGTMSLSCFCKQTEL